MHNHLNVCKQMTDVKLQCLKPFDCANKWLIVNRIIHVRLKYLKPFNCLQKKLAQAPFKMLLTKCVYKSYAFNIFV